MIVAIHENSFECGRSATVGYHRSAAPSGTFDERGPNPLTAAGLASLNDLSASHQQRHAARQPRRRWVQRILFLMK